MLPEARFSGLSGIPSEERKARQQRKAVEAEIRNRHYRRTNPLMERVAAIETEIVSMGARLNEVEAMLADPETYKATGQIADLGREHQRLKGRIDSLTDEWGRLTAEAEGLAQEFEREMGEIR
jgi:predicted  nucleic acid-binding Zn-ribbon protein